MKGIVSVGAVALLVAATAGPAAAQTRYITECVNAAVDQAKSAGSYSGYGAPNSAFCLLGGWVRQGQTLVYSMTLDSDKDYLFVGAGDSDVKDLDLSVSDGKNTVEDTETDNTPWVHIDNSGTPTVTITMTNYQGSGQADFCCLIILEEGGAPGSHKALKEAAGKLVTWTDKVIEQAEGFHTDNTPGTGSFCMFGGLFGSGGELGFHRPFTTGHYAVLAMGDKNAVDVDLKVQEGSDEVAADTATDANPVVEFQTEEDKTLTVTLRMHEAKANSFGLGLILSNN